MARPESVIDNTNTNTDPTCQARVMDTENPTTRSEEKRLSALVEGHSCLYTNTYSSKHANKRKEAWKKKLLKTMEVVNQ